MIMEAVVSLDGFIAGDDDAVIRTTVGNIRAVVIGRHLFDIINGWNGVPAAADHVFVVTHEPPTDWPSPTRRTPSSPAAADRPGRSTLAPLRAAMAARTPASTGVPITSGTVPTSAHPRAFMCHSL